MPAHPSTPPAKSALTTGSANARIEAAQQLDQMASGAFDEALTALSAPANEEPRYVRVRQLLCRMLVAIDPARAVQELEAHLPGETRPVQEAIYELFIEIDSEAADRALVRSFREQKGSHEFLGQILWRKESAVEMLVREDLVPAWSADRKYAKRILKLVHDECLRVPRAWVADAPEELKTALGDRLVD